MPRIANRQPALKAQDLYLLLALAAWRGESITYPELAAFAGLSMSEVHELRHHHPVSSVAYK